MGESGFTLGDHTFLHPSVNGPLSRFEEAPSQIRNAPPPTYLEGRVREATLESPAARALLEGRFCGHGEPTMTVFDIVLDGEDVLELGASMDPDDPDMTQNLLALAVRRPGQSEWFPIFRRAWEDEQATLEGFTTSVLTESEAASISDDVAIGRVSVGFEYPCDADSRDCVTWMTIDVVFEGEEEPRCIVDAELA